MTTTSPTVEFRPGPAVVKDWIERGAAAEITKANTKAKRAKQPTQPNPFALFDEETPKARVSEDELRAIAEDCRAFQKADGPRGGAAFRSLRQCYERAAIKAEAFLADFASLAEEKPSGEELEGDEFRLPVEDGEKIVSAAKAPKVDAPKRKGKDAAAKPSTWTKDKELSGTYYSDVEGWSIVQKHSTAWLLSTPAGDVTEHKTLKAAKEAAAN